MKIHYGKIDDRRFKSDKGYELENIGNTICGNFQVPTTEDIKEVTCQNCLKAIESDLKIAKENVFGKELN